MTGKEEQETNKKLYAELTTEKEDLERILTLGSNTIGENGHMIELMIWRGYWTDKIIPGDKNLGKAVGCLLADHTFRRSIQMGRTRVIGNSLQDQILLSQYKKFSHFMPDDVQRSMHTMRRVKNDPLTYKAVSGVRKALSFLTFGKVKTLLPYEEYRSTYDRCVCGAREALEARLEKCKDFLSIRDNQKEYHINELYRKTANAIRFIRSSHPLGEQLRAKYQSFVDEYHDGDFLAAGLEARRRGLVDWFNKWLVTRDEYEQLDKLYHHRPASVWRSGRKMSVYEMSTSYAAARLDGMPMSVNAYFLLRDRFKNEPAEGGLPRPAVRSEPSKEDVESRLKELGNLILFPERKAAG